MIDSPQLRALGDPLGMEALGIDLAKPLDDETFAWIGDALAKHPVLVFRDQISVPPNWEPSGGALGRRVFMR